MATSFFGPVLDLLTVGDPTCKGHCHPYKLSFPVITLPWRSLSRIPREPSWKPAWEEAHAGEQQTCLLSPALPLTCSVTSRALSSGSLALSSGQWEDLIRSTFPKLVPLCVTVRVCTIAVYPPTCHFLSFPLNCLLFRTFFFNLSEFSHFKRKLYITVAIHLP